MKRIFSCILTLVLVFSLICIVPAEAANNPKFTANPVTELSETDAKISVRTTFSQKMTFTGGGFYIGTSKENMHKNAYPDSCNIKSSYLISSFLMSKYKEPLQPGTTYYYKTYCIANGKTYTSPIYSFTTKINLKAQNTPGTTWTPTVSNIYFDRADFAVSVTLPEKAQMTECGFSIGTSYKNMQKAANPMQLSGSGNSAFATFNTYKCQQKLSPNTAYYYQYYIIAGGKTYVSGIYSFRTLAVDNYVSATPTDVTKTNAVLKLKFNNLGATKASRLVVQFGTAADNMQTIYNATFLSAFMVQMNGLDLNAAGQTLKAGTTYYYRVGVQSVGNVYYGKTQSFCTMTDATQLVFPLPTDKVWYCSTYEGHGNVNASARCSIDIKLKNGKNCSGLPVYAMADGVVHRDAYKNSNGQITIKHTVPLTTINGVVYKTWYVTYAHMQNITVKKGDKVKAGQQVGQVGSVGKADGAHLHVSIGSGNGGTGWYQETNVAKSISPYYLLGFVNEKGENTPYLIRDMKGPAVTKWLIGHKPTGK